jgi:hypothetical protein
MVLSTSGDKDLLGGFQTANTTIKQESRLVLETSHETIPLAGDLLCPVVVQTAENGTGIIAEGNTLLHAAQKSAIDYIFNEMSDDNTTLKKMRLNKRENITKVLFQVSSRIFTIACLCLSISPRFQFIMSFN